MNSHLIPRCKMLLIGEAWGREEDEMNGNCANNAFVGSAGQLLFEMLGSATPNLESKLHAEAMKLAHKGSMQWLIPRDQWLDLAGIKLTNVLDFRPPNNKIAEVCITKDELPSDYNLMPIVRHPRALYLHPSHIHHIKRLYDTINNLRPNLIVALGNTALWATLGTSNIGSIRGSITSTKASYDHIHPPAIKLLPIYHPAALLHSSMKGMMSKPVSIADFMKAFRECEFSEIRRPVRWVTVNPTIEECEAWTNKIKDFAINGMFKWLSCDIETSRRQIKCISFAYCEHESLVIPFWPDERESYWPTAELELRAWDCVTELLSLMINKLGQNFIYDLQYLRKAPLGKPIIIGPNGGEDSMLLHHSWYPEMPKGLGFLASVHTNEASWKTMRRKRPDSEKRDE